MIDALKCVYECPKRWADDPGSFSYAEASAFTKVMADRQDRPFDLASTFTKVTVDRQDREGRQDNYLLWLEFT